MRNLSFVLYRWLSPRALLLHLMGVAWVTGCVLAAYWQVGRAAQGNVFSYLYAIEWPVFAVAGIMGWWALVHTDPTSSEERAARRSAEAALRARAHVASVGVFVARSVWPPRKRDRRRSTRLAELCHRQRRSRRGARQAE